MGARRRYSEDELDYIFGKFGGICYGCGKQLSRNNYGPRGDMIRRRSGWEVDHYISLADGGSDSLDNLFALCIPDNMLKRDRTIHVVWEYHGRDGFPLDPEERSEQRRDNAVKGALVGGLGAVALGLSGPLGWAAAALGAKLWHDSEPDDQKEIRRPRWSGKKR